MPAILILFFLIAVTLTLLGLFLSPKHPAPHPHNEYLVTPRGRRIVESAPVPTRTGRQAPVMRDGEIRRRASAHRAGEQGIGGNEIGRRAHVYRADEQMIRGSEIGRRLNAHRANEQGAVAIFGGTFPAWVGSWKVLIPGLAVLFVLSLYLFSMLFPYSPIWTASPFGQAAAAVPPVSGLPVFTATQHLTRLNQLDPAQYQSSQEYTTWADSACSAASMTEVINAYGHQYRITDILKVEANIGEITPQLGLLEDVGIQRTAAKFGFKTSWGHHLSLDQVITAANSGMPVIVGIPPSRLPGGHLLVVHGGDSNNVYLTDSSLRDWSQLTRARFLQLWGGLSAILTPA